MRATDRLTEHAPAWDGASARLDAIGGPIAICSLSGDLVAATRAASSILARLGIPTESLPCALPADLWRDLAAARVGEAIEWRPGSGPDCLGATRYPLGDRHALILMREVSEKQSALSHRLHQQRLEAVGRLVATIAHELRAPLASVVFDADVLGRRARELSPEDVATLAESIHAASQRLRENVDGLLEFAKLGPQVVVDVALGDVVARAASIVRAAFRDGGHTLEIAVGDERASGNPLLMEQILVNLLLNAAEAWSVATHVTVTCRPSVERGAVEIVVADDGPGVADDLRARIFEPFFTTKPTGTGLGLTTAREAARSLSGDLLLADGPGGATFVLRVPMASAPGSEPA